jgi:hypothetical protein
MMSRARFAVLGAWLSLCGSCNPFPSFDGFTGSDSAPSSVTCGSGSTLLCENFDESTSLGNSWATSTMYGGSVTVDPNRKKHGTASLHLMIPANAFDAVAQITASLSLPSSYWIRLFVYAASPVDDRVGIDFVAVNSADGATDDIQVTPYGNGTMTLSYGGNDQSSEAFQLDQWHCIEWQVMPSTMQVYLDGVPTPNATPTAVNADQVVFGWDLSGGGASAAENAWIDEIIIDAGRVGCNAFQSP